MVSENENYLWPWIYASYQLQGQLGPYIPGIGQIGAPPPGLAAPAVLASVPQTFSPIPPSQFLGKLLFGNA